MNIGNTKANNYSLPLRVHQADIDNLPPLERAFAQHLINTKPGEIFVIVDDIAAASE